MVTGYHKEVIMSDDNNGIVVFKITSDINLLFWENSQKLEVRYRDHTLFDLHQQELYQLHEFLEYLITQGDLKPC
jgi:hypothetical protein